MSVRTGAPRKLEWLYYTGLSNMPSLYFKVFSRKTVCCLSLQTLFWNTSYCGLDSISKAHFRDISGRQPIGKRVKTVDDETIHDIPD